MSKETVIAVLAVSMLVAWAVVLHGASRYLRRQHDAVQVWLGWMLVGLASFLIVGAGGVAIAQAFGAEHPESGIALGAGALALAWIWGIFRASKVTP